MGTTMSKLASSDYECIFGTNYLNESVLGARIKLSRRVALPAYGSLRSTEWWKMEVTIGFLGALYA